MKEKLPIPTEHVEAVALAEYLEILKTQGRIVLFSHIPHETFTRNWGTKMKNKREGVRSGVPDYIIVTTEKILFIEMKRIKGGVLSEEQKKWQAGLQHKTTHVVVSYGFEDAKRFLDSII